MTASIPSPPPGTTLLIFAGKGGVGKTTLACATALHLAKRSSGRSVLLVSTGPSHSLSSCLDMPVDSQPQYVLPGVTAIEIDSEAEFEAILRRFWKRSQAILTWHSIARCWNESSIFLRRG